MLSLTGKILKQKFRHHMLIDDLCVYKPKLSHNFKVKVKTKLQDLSNYLFQNMKLLSFNMMVLTIYCHFSSVSAFDTDDVLSLPWKPFRRSIMLVMFAVMKPID